MKAPFSAYLQKLAPTMKELIGILEKDCEYVSILSTDSVGFSASVSQTAKNISGTNRTTERGNVVRIRRHGQYSEFAFNDMEGKTAAQLAEEMLAIFDRQTAMLTALGVRTYETGILDDEPCTLFVEKETEILPEKADMDQIISMFEDLSKKGISLVEGAIDCQIGSSSTHISKMFLSKNRDLRQSYVYSEASAAVLAPNEAGEMKFFYEGVSGITGPEIFRGLYEKLEHAPKVMESLKKAVKIVPGEYTVITSPEVTGLIAHEAFGHGVEMDMFVKNRALGADYIDKRVGSDLVTMHEGARCADSVTAYAFDDEGTLAGDVIEIDHGILKTGICDALAAKRLGIAPTGNGKRENFAHKAYTRMTNTVFDSGDDTLEDMIASVDYGYLLEGMESGMEDPKHWGIQCIIGRGYEIKDGKLTGEVVAPVVMTGYVPDLLGNISMASRDREVFGNGACGKGHKEWVKVADGGPYLKTKAR